MRYKELMDRSKEFYDTIDFTPFFSDCAMNLDALRRDIEEYYEDNHPELIPKDFDGCFFNFMDDYEFALYLKNRYGFSMHEEVVEKYYLYK